MQDTAINQLTERIYDAAIDPTAWGAVMHGLRQIYPGLCTRFAWRRRSDGLSCWNAPLFGVAIGAVCAALGVAGNGWMRGTGPVAQVSIRSSRVSARAKMGWFGVELGRWIRSFRFATSTTAASLIRRNRKVSN